MIDLDDEFEELMRKSQPGVPIYTTQYRESRRVFYAGAAAMFLGTMRLATLPDDQAEEGMSDLQKQLEAFFHDRLPNDRD
jgi:hypothetical protein